MDVQKMPVEANELENSLARWAARIAAVLLVGSMAAMPSVVAWLDEDAAAAAAAPRSVVAGARAAPPPVQAPGPDGGRGMSAPLAPASSGGATAGLWSAPVDRVVPLAPAGSPPAAAGYGSMSDEEWLDHVMQRVGERANWTVAAAFRAMDGFLFERRPAARGSVLLPPAPLEVGPAPGGIAPLPATPLPAAQEPAADAGMPDAGMPKARAVRPPADGIARPPQAPTARPPAVAARPATVVAPMPLRPAAAPVRRTAGVGSPEPADGQGGRASSTAKGRSACGVDGLATAVRAPQMAMADASKQEYSGGKGRFGAFGVTIPCSGFITR